MTGERGAGRILIVDDEPAIRLVLTHTLQAGGMEVVTASRLEAAEEALNRLRFDLAVVDLNLRGVLTLGGLELLSYIKREWPKTKVIILTGCGSEEIRQEAIKRGADYYYEKGPADDEVVRIFKDIGTLLRHEHSPCRWP